MTQFSIIIQGPINDISLSYLDIYKQYGPVIVSCWDTDKVPDDLKGVTIIKNHINIENYANPQNIFMQATTTLSALRLVDTEYFIKVRSDEKYSNLQPIVDKVLSNVNKYVCNNIWFKKIDKEWLHPSDHLIAGKTLLFLNMFFDIIATCIRVGRVDNVLNCHQYGFQNSYWPYLGVESVMFLSFLKSFYGQELEKVVAHYNSNGILKQLLEKHCDFVPIDQLGDYTWSFVNIKGQREYLTNSDLLYNWPDSPSIRTLEDA